MSVYTDLCNNVADYFEKSYREWKVACDSGDPLARYPRWVAAHKGGLKAARYWRKRAKEVEKVTSF